MGKKIVIGGIVAGLVMFFWSFVAHMVLPTGMMGFSSTPQDDVLLPALRSNITSDGMYIVPSHDMMQAIKGGASQQQAMEVQQKKYGNGPWALVVFHSSGAGAMETRMLVNEALSQLVAGLILATVLAMAAVRVRSFGGRVAFITLIGLLPWLQVDFSYWNWWGFPADYQVAQLIDQGVGALLASIALALIFKNE